MKSDSPMSRQLRGRAGLVVLLFLVVVPLGIFRARYAASGEDERSALVHALALRGVTADTDAIVIFDEASSPLAYREMLFLGSEDGAPRDVYYAAVRIADDTVVDLDALTNVTKSPGAAEHALVRSGRHAAFVSLVRGAVDAITVVALDGEPLRETAGFTRVERLQHRITNLQETGRMRGFGRVRYALNAPAERAVLSVVDGDLNRVFAQEIADHAERLRAESEKYYGVKAVAFRTLLEVVHTA